MVMKTVAVHQQLANTTSQTTTLQIPTGGKIHDIFLRFTTSAGAISTEAQIRADITGNIRLSFGGIDMVNVPMARLLDIYKIMGSRVGKASTLVAGVLNLNLARIFYDDPKAKDLFGIGTAGVTNIQVQIGCGTIANANNVQTFTTRTAENEAMGTYGKLIDYPRNFNATGDDTVDTLPRNINSAYLALFVNAGASGVITTNEVRVNGQIIREKTPKEVNSLMNSNYGFNSDGADSAGEGVYMPVIFAHGALDAYLPMKNVTDLRFVTNFSTAPGSGGYYLTPLTLENFAGT